MNRSNKVLLKGGTSLLGLMGIWFVVAGALSLGFLAAAVYVIMLVLQSFGVV